MNQEICEGCGLEFPMNETFKIRDITYCGECGEKILEEQNDISGDEVEQQVDPTVCINCNHDNGEDPLSTVAELPMCKQCETFFRNRPFPGWVKVAFAAVIIFVGFSLFWNLRFIKGYREMRQSMEAMSQSDTVKAAVLMQAAADHVPESHDLEMQACIFQGIFCLQEDKSKEALDLFKRCRREMPPEFGVDNLIIYAEIGVAFDKGDYDRFLELAIKISEEDHDDFILTAQVASAYACKYAVIGEEEFKVQTLSQLEKAKKNGKGDPDLEEYEQRILYRIHSREIIKRDEFKERFPNGWQESDKE